MIRSSRITNSSPPKRAIVSPGRTARQALGGGDQQLVAGAVAERVVDDLEVVDVGEQHREAGVGLAAALERVGQRAVEERAVGQAGQRIVVGLVDERARRPACGR